MLKRSIAMVRLRCPRCLQGKVFRSLWHMYDTCPECQLKFEREEGYFFGAMYFSYGMGIALALPTTIYLMLTNVSQWLAFSAITSQLAILSPLLFRYSRVIWLHFDQYFDAR